MHPTLFELSLFGLLPTPWPLQTYGLCVAMGFLCAMHLASRQAERELEDKERMIDLTFYLLIAGLIGARVVFILTKLDHYLQAPLDIFKFWTGGLVWYGGFIAAVGYMVYYTHKHRLNFFKYVDILMPCTALAHAFGRLGCLAAGCCFGKPTNLPFAIVFPHDSMAHRAQVADHLIGFYDKSLAVHPTQLYEACGELSLFWFLTFFRPYKRFHGQLFLIWLAVYPLLRSAIEMMRGDKERGVYVLSTSQYISIVVFFAAMALIFLRKNHILDSAAKKASAS